MTPSPDQPRGETGEAEEAEPFVARPRPDRDSRAERLLIRREPVPRPPPAPPRRPGRLRRPRRDPGQPRVRPELGFFRGLLIAVPVSALLWAGLFALARWALSR